MTRVSSPPPYTLDPEPKAARAPEYTASPNADERTLLHSLRTHNRSQRTGTFVRSDDGGRLTLVLVGQKDDNALWPTVGPNTIISGTVLLASSEGIVSVSLQLEGEMEVLSISLGYTCTKTVDQSISLFSRNASTAPCPNALPFSFRLPTTFSTQSNGGGASLPLPPSCDIAFGDGGFLKCFYSLTLCAAYRSAAFFEKKRSLRVELEYRHRTRPSRPRIPDLSLLATVKLCPEEWLQLPVDLTMADEGQALQAADIRCDLFVPSVGVFAISEIIPFHLQLSGKLQSLRECCLLPRPYGALAFGSNLDTVRQPIRVYLLRQVVLTSSEPKRGTATVTAKTTLCQAALRSIPPPHRVPPTPDGVKDDHVLSWDGELPLRDALVPTFDAGASRIVYLIAVELSPPKSSKIKRAHYGFPIKLTTDTWAGSAEGQE
ncbi:DUF3844 domain-containing protein [Mycena kentingensis (nom. inval.)]|nr:DUF3844 domain-containing protein [Mycena kentingensis (nom. inval.)]